jgi:hypothetical protein
MAFRIIQGGIQGVRKQGLGGSPAVGVKGQVADDGASFPESLDSVSLENETPLGRDIKAVPPLKAPYQSDPVAQAKAKAAVAAFEEFLKENPGAFKTFLS